MNSISIQGISNYRESPCMCVCVYVNVYTFLISKYPLFAEMINHHLQGEFLEEFDNLQHNLLREFERY